MATDFETITCGRCGGTGEYSYCQMYGRVCFQCAGAKRVYTKRGSAAKRYYLALLTVPISHVKPGDLYRIDPGPMNKGGFSPVERVEFNPVGSAQHGVRQSDGTWAYVTEPEYVVHTKAMVLGGISPTAMVRVGHSAEFKAQARAKALAFQATLTKMGKPRKAGKAPSTCPVCRDAACETKSSACGQ